MWFLMQILQQLHCAVTNKNVALCGYGLFGMQLRGIDIIYRQTMTVILVFALFLVSVWSIREIRNVHPRFPGDRFEESNTFFYELIPQIDPWYLQQTMWMLPFRNSSSLPQDISLSWISWHVYLLVTMAKILLLRNDPQKLCRHIGLNWNHL